MEVDGSVSSSGDDPLDHIGRITVVKSINFRYNMLLRWDAGTKDSSTKRLMFKVLFFFMISCRILCKNALNLFVSKIKVKSSECPKSIKSLKKIILGTSDAWSMIRLSNRPSDPA